MAMYNRDGTRYSPETIREMLDIRFEREPFAQVSDLLGSDWGANYPTPRSSTEYQEFAYRAATQVYGRY